MQENQIVKISSSSLPGINGLGAFPTVPTPGPENSRAFYFYSQREKAPQRVCLYWSPPCGQMDPAYFHEL